jgi:hypothetical protein
MKLVDWFTEGGRDRLELGLANGAAEGAMGDCFEGKVDGWEECSEYGNAYEAMGTGFADGTIYDVADGNSRGSSDDVEELVPLVNLKMHKV